MSFRDIKRQARRDLHDAMRVPALFIANVGATPVLIHVRVHTKFEDIGEVSDRDVGNAVRHERSPKLLFMIAELEAQGIQWRRMPRGAVISVEPGEAYRVDNTEPPDDITVSAFVSVMPQHETMSLPVPGDA